MKNLKDVARPENRASGFPSVDQQGSDTPRARGVSTETLEKDQIGPAIGRASSSQPMGQPLKRTTSKGLCLPVQFKLAGTSGDSSSLPRLRLTREKAVIYLGEADNVPSIPVSLDFSEDRQSPSVADEDARLMSPGDDAQLSDPARSAGRKLSHSSAQTPHLPETVAAAGALSAPQSEHGTDVAALQGISTAVAAGKTPLPGTSAPIKTGETSQLMAELVRPHDRPEPIAPAPLAEAPRPFSRPAASPAPSNASAGVEREATPTQPTASVASSGNSSKTAAADSTSWLAAKAAAKQSLENAKSAGRVANSRRYDDCKSRNMHNYRKSGELNFIESELYPPPNSLRNYPQLLSSITDNRGRMKIGELDLTALFYDTTPPLGVSEFLNILAAEPSFTGVRYETDTGLQRTKVPRQGAPGVPRRSEWFVAGRDRILQTDPGGIPGIVDMAGNSLPSLYAHHLNANFYPMNQASVLSMCCLHKGDHINLGRIAAFVKSRVVLDDLLIHMRPGPVFNKTSTFVALQICAQAVAKSLGSDRDGRLRVGAEIMANYLEYSLSLGSDRNIISRLIESDAERATQEQEKLAQDIASFVAVPPGYDDRFFSEFTAALVAMIYGGASQFCEAVSKKNERDREAAVKVSSVVATGVKFGSGFIPIAGLSAGIGALADYAKDQFKDFMDKSQKSGPDKFFRQELIQNFILDARNGTAVPGYAARVLSSPLSASEEVEMRERAELGKIFIDNIKLFYGSIAGRVELV